MAYKRGFKHKKYFNKNSNFKSFEKRVEFEKPKGLTVIVRNNDVQKALRKLKRIVKEDGLLDDLKNKSHYRKPSEIKREKRKAGRARWLKKRRDIKNQLGY
tara:strand:+ start:368 stop:670 length:303 start_codon:yes stop_codon:yes gene_type:complete